MYSAPVHAARFATPIRVITERLDLLEACISYRESSQVSNPPYDISDYSLKVTDGTE